MDVSGDGSVVVGNGSTAPNDQEAARWTAQGGFAALDTRPGSKPPRMAWGASADGNVVVGHVFEPTQAQAFRWTAETGIVELGLLPGTVSSSARRVSADGSVVVGVAVASNDSRGDAFRWTEQDGMVDLGDLPGARYATIAYDVSADGSVIVGTSAMLGEGGTEAFYWTAATGMVNLQEMLISAGVTNLDGWTLNQARGVSYNGLTIVGLGTHGGSVEPWVATIPEPATMGLAIVAVLAAIVVSLRSGRRRM